MRRRASSLAVPNAREFVRIAATIAPVEYFDAACCSILPSDASCHGLSSLGDASASASTSSGSRPISPRFIACRIAA